MKKLLCIILAIVMVASTFAIVASAYSWSDPDCLTVEEGIDMWMFDNDKEMPERHRYYFLMPDGTNGERGDNAEGEAFGQFAPTWYIPMSTGQLSTSTAGIYWWGTKVADPAAWIGYLPSGEDENDPNIYYADVPVAVSTIVWNNAVDGGTDETAPIYKCAAQTINIPCEYYDPGESPNYPNGTESFDNMIFVVDPDVISKSDASEKQTCGGEWYYYYGNGCYGFTEGGSEADCLRDDHYDANGNHVIPEVHKPTAPEIVEPELLGDVDGDGLVDIVDVSEIQLHLASLQTLDSKALAAADANRDGEVNILDATQIQRLLAKLIKEL